MEDLAAILLPSIKGTSSPRRPSGPPEGDSDNSQALAVKLEALEGTLTLLSGDVVASRFGLETLGELASLIERDLRSQSHFNRLLPVCLAFKEAVATLAAGVQAKKPATKRITRIRRLGEMLATSLRRSLMIQKPTRTFETHCARFK